MANGLNSPIENERTSSKRFARSVPRRDVLGLASRWSAIVAWGTALLGVLRLPMPGVLPGQGSRFKIGKPTRYMAGSVTFLPEQKVYIFATERGFYAISAVCTHLGCLVQKQNTPSKEFLCPCHGSKFAADGRLLVGPAPSGLPWLAMSLSADGQLLVDGQKNVPPGTQFVV